MHSSNLINIIVIIFIAIGITVPIVSYFKTETVNIEVYDVELVHNVSSDTEGHTRTTQYYLVQTDKGLLQIEINGILSNPVAVGQLKQLGKHRVVTRGYNIPFLGEYPRIVSVIE